MKIQTVIDEYQKRKVTLGKAANLAGISIWEMIEKIKEKNHHPLYKRRFRKRSGSIEERKTIVDNTSFIRFLTY